MVPIVANQIDLICALQLIIVEGSLAAHIGGSARVLPGLLHHPALPQNGDR
jgi:hypothetical protein